MWKDGLLLHNHSLLIPQQLPLEHLYALKFLLTRGRESPREFVSIPFAARFKTPVALPVPLPLPIRPFQG
jgi:hypothetical protein